MRYIMIFEDSRVFKSDVVTEDEKNACGCGILDVIDTETMKQYHDNEWHDLGVWGE